MALFTKLKARVIGSGLSFDSLESISKKEDEKADEEGSFPHQSHNVNVNVFSKERKTSQDNIDVFNDPTKKSKLVNIMPSGDSENIPPSNRMSGQPPQLGKVPSFTILEKKSSFKAEALTQISPRPNPSAASDNRFATSRGNSFIQPVGVAQQSPRTHAPSISMSSASMDSNTLASKSLEDEDVFEYKSDEEDVEDDQIELIFSKARHNHADVVINAIKNGFDVNSTDIYGNTIIHICAQNNHRKLASLLVQHFPQCLVNRRNLKGLTPLDYAEKYGFQKMSAWLNSVSNQNTTHAMMQTVNSNMSKMR